MKFKANQRVAYYRVEATSDPSPAANVGPGSVLIDRPRGKWTQWDFLRSDGTEGWITGNRIGFAIVDPKTMEPVPEPELQAVLDAMKDPS